MPRPKKPGAPEPKKRSRNGCWPCKGRKVKCGEERPNCLNCQRIGETCDYSIRLNWDGRRSKRGSDAGTEPRGQFSGVRRRELTIINHVMPDPATPIQPSRSNSIFGSAGSGGTMDFGSFRAPLENVSNESPTMSENHGFDNHIDSMSMNGNSGRQIMGGSAISNTPPINGRHPRGSIHGSISERHSLPTSPTSPRSYGIFGEPNSPAFGHKDGSGLAPSSMHNNNMHQRQDSGQIQHQGMSQNRSMEKPLFSSFQANIQYNGIQGQLPLPGVQNHALPPPPPPPHSVSSSSTPTSGVHPQDPDNGFHMCPVHQSRHASFSHAQSPSMSRLSEPSPMTSTHSSLGEDDTHMTNSGHLVPSPPVIPTGGGTPQSPTHSAPTPRVDVHSLLSETPISYPEKTYPIVVPWNEVHLWDANRVAMDSKCDDTFFFGFDLGRKDRDILENDDMNAIVLELPNGEVKAESPPNAQDLRISDAWAMPSNNVDGEYYKEPVKIIIPRKFMPLPESLSSNPMNLLYFHHFLTHTAKVLMPYDDAERNPYRAVLPEIAVAEPHLLSLLLAYSASHRARVLGHKEPEVRMANWITYVIPNLQIETSGRASIASLASTIMLASLEIISPNAFGSQIGWQSHLGFAREMMMNRRLWRPDIKTKEGECCAFLWSWFAYLDVLGSLSGGQWSHDVSPEWVEYYDRMGDDSTNLDEIDCIMGFSVRCSGLLARVSDFCRRSQKLRTLPDGRFNPHWKPDGEMLEDGMDLDRRLLDSLKRNTVVCNHIRPGCVDRDSLMEIFATNEAFHWAGLVHLRRRGLNGSSTDASVTEAVNKIVEAMSYIRPGGTGETGFLFPMFTAGCESTQQNVRDEIVRRFNNVEAHGMKQVSKAKELMQLVWKKKQPWETLMKDEFIG